MKLDNALCKDNINRNLLRIEYAVRGPVAERALQIERELEKVMGEKVQATELNTNANINTLDVVQCTRWNGRELLMRGVKKPFNRVVKANIGDCHALGQKPITFLRQMLAVTSYPELLKSPDIPEDVKTRAKEILDDCKQGSVGAYSPPQGLLSVRACAARYLTARDGAGVPASPHNILLGSGASDLIRSLLQLLCQYDGGKMPGVLIPCPQYPVFSGTLSELGLHQVPYYLDEARGWHVPVEELERALGTSPAPLRAIVIINPGNPTGQVLSRENIEQIVKFSHRHRLLVLADEVYQENIVSKPFHSCKKVMYEMGRPYCDTALASFLTVSKGWAAECGARAALLELLNVPGEAQHALLAARALQQCPSVLGQVALYSALNSPRPGEPSYPQFARELQAIRDELSARTALAYQTFNSIPGYSCNQIDGAMFAFPRVVLPARAQSAAQAAGLQPDTFYCLQLLEHTGICVVPGSGFGQREGTYHFRTTILHRQREFTDMMHTIARFHRNFLHKYS